MVSEKDTADFIVSIISTFLLQGSKFIVY
jgi:hypothetical protein